MDGNHDDAEVKRLPVAAGVVVVVLLLLAVLLSVLERRQRGLVTTARIVAAIAAIASLVALKACTVANKSPWQKLCCRNCRQKCS